jgi:hypothetical protein
MTIPMLLMLVSRQYVSTSDDGFISIDFGVRDDELEVSVRTLKLDRSKCLDESRRNEYVETAIRSLIDMRALDNSQIVARLQLKVREEVMLWRANRFHDPKNETGCSAEQSEAQANLIDSARISLCSHSRWMALVQLALPTATIFFDVGANRGYWSASIFGLWLPHLNFNPATLFMDEEGNPIMGGYCGWCADCRDTAEPLTGIQTTLANLPKASHGIPNHIRARFAKTKVFAFEGSRYFEHSCYETG